MSDIRELFIPFRRTDIINLCLEDGKLQGKDVQLFQEFCDILTAFFHFRFHYTLEKIKDNYTVFNPNSDVQTLQEPSLEEYEEMENKVLQGFKYILERANYIQLSDEIIQKSLQEKSLINLQTDVDFNDFDQFYCYYRGDVNELITFKKLKFFKQEKIIDILERVVLLIKFKGQGYFQAKAKKDKQYQDLNFIPGKMYLYFYKNIPKLDLDLLFPNIQTSMTWKDKLLFGVPAIGAAVPLIVRAIPNILLIIVAILLLLKADSVVDSIEVDQRKVRDIMPILVATLSLAMTLGGFAVKQYTKYKSKEIKFQKEVSDTLFFKNLANNASVFQALTDIAEEEECKEIILVYYHLLTSQEKLTPEKLDQKIEQWMMEKLGITIDFDIHGPLSNLEKLRGKIVYQDNNENQINEVPLLSYDEQGNINILSLEQSKMILDYVWDNAFQYNGC
ncbi:TMEM143 family protein [Crocosphaera chwakensis]|uniref:Putative orphan protein putative membrane protein n=1 Tax=Crocosphaera chwakensis CCY0110 TaxID=391612 RepID=A3IRA0_9CHRO|nr:TMEM143 family protein [Crocosphaera chwakensis]EAZ91090.1 putative orphan protein; putative membrane protein [Crocosphaera chwakensis CCY0110]